MPPEWSLRPATDADRDFRFELERVVFREAVDALWGWDDEEQRSASTSGSPPKACR